MRWWLLCCFLALDSTTAAAWQPPKDEEITVQWPEGFKHERVSVDVLERDDTSVCGYRAKGTRHYVYYATGLTKEHTLKKVVRRALANGGNLELKQQESNEAFFTRPGARLFITEMKDLKTALVLRMETDRVEALYEFDLTGKTVKTGRRDWLNVCKEAADFLALD